MKGRATSLDIQRGRTTQEDKAGNDGAHALAVAGSKLHRVPSEVVEAASQSKQ